MNGKERCAYMNVVSHTTQQQQKFLGNGQRYPGVELMYVSWDCQFLGSAVFPMHSSRDSLENDLAATIRSGKYSVPLGSRQNLQ